MAFAIRNLSVLAYANGFTLWHYKTRVDDMTNVMSDNHMVAAHGMVTQGDMILVNATDGARVVVVAVADERFERVTLAPLA